MHSGTVEAYSRSEAPLVFDKKCDKFWGKFPRRILGNFSRETGSRGYVLDLGSGSGRGSVLLRIFGKRVICLDASPTMVQYTNKNLDFPSIRGDFENLPFAESAFRGVWACRSLINIPKEEVHQTLSEIRRVLIPYGVLGVVMIEPTPKRMGNSISLRDGIETLVARYDAREMDGLLGNHGFNVFDYDQIRTSSKFFIMLARKDK